MEEGREDKMQRLEGKDKRVKQMCENSRKEV